MLTKDEARNLLMAELARLNHESKLDLVILDDSTREKPWGWIFFYNSERFLKTREFRYALGGNAPIIVNRENGAIWYTGTAHPIDHYIEEYEGELRRGNCRPTRR